MFNIIGAFGTAVLYKKLADDSMVVIKEINMTDLTASERYMALNEVEVLSILHHANIIRFVQRRILSAPLASTHYDLRTNMTCLLIVTSI